MTSLFNELKRRNVFRVGIAYAVVGWLLIQVTDIILPTFGAPDWVQKVVILIIALGLPVSLLLAWAYEMTPQGVVKTEEVDQSESITSSTGQKLNVIVIGVLVIALAFFVWERQRLIDESSEAVVAASGEQPAPADSVENRRSIAVLPFVNMSSDAEQEWFADGLTEELLNSLARTADLLVAARTSSFKYKGSQEDIPTIAAALGVAHVLEGSVRRSGERLRVTAQLIRAADGFHLWSETYDRDTDDVISVQEELAIAIANALETAMDPAALAAMVSSGTSSVPAYEAYLEGLSAEARYSVAGDDNYWLAARDAYQLARELDPGFSAAHYRMAEFYWSQMDVASITANMGTQSADLLRSQYDAAVVLALKTTTDETLRAYYEARLAFVDLKYVQALNRIDDVIRRSPNNRDALSMKVSVLLSMGRRSEAAATLRTVQSIASDDANELEQLITSFFFAGASEEALPVISKALSLHPNNAFVAYQAQRALLWAGKYDDARPLVAAVQSSDMRAGNAPMVLLRQACADGNLKDAEKYYAQVVDTGSTTFAWLAHTLLGDVAAANALLMKYYDADEMFALASYLPYPNFDASAFPKLQAILDAQGIVRDPPLPVPYACNRP